MQAIRELDDERNGQWVRAIHPGREHGEEVEGELEVSSNFGDTYAIRLTTLEGRVLQPHNLQSAGYVFYRMDEPHEAAYRRGFRDGLKAAREMIDIQHKTW